jgi:ATP-dependent exoDNAse (exonuclease V) alpha subunit
VTNPIARNARLHSLLAVMAGIFGIGAYLAQVNHVAVIDTCLLGLSSLLYEFIPPLSGLKIAQAPELITALVAAILAYLECPDQFSALSGSSGVGKTYALADIIKANLAAGHHVAIVAPSDAARDVLRREGKELGYSVQATALQGAVSLQLHQADPRRHALLGKGDLLIIDEASMVSLAQGHLELERARKVGYRVMFVGDLDQQKAIEAGDLFRLIISTGVHTAELHDIRRQSETALNFHYRVAVQLMKKGKTTAAFKELLQAGCVHEVQGQARIEAIAAKLLEREEAGIPTMLANLSHRENDLIAAAIRRKMTLSDERTLTVSTTLGWSNAQKQDFSKLRRCSSIVSLDGMALEITRGKVKGEQWFVLKGDTGKGSIAARTRDGKFRKFTAADYKTFDVCESKSIPVAIGDRLFARSSNRRGNIINGEELKVSGWDSKGNPIDQNGRSVTHRNLCYAYASTSHKVQGSAKIAVIGGLDKRSVKSICREAVYVITGRGRDLCDWYVENIADLSQIQSRSSERKLSTDMPTQGLPADLQKLKDRLEPKAMAKLSHDHDDDRNYQQDYNYDRGHEVGGWGIER